MSYQGGVRINTRLDLAQMKKDLTAAERDIARLSKAFDGATLSVKKQEIALKDLQRRYDALVEGEKTPASLVAMQTSLRNIESEIREIEKANKDLIEQYELAAKRADEFRPFGGTTFEEAAAEADKLAEKLRPAWDRMDELNAKAKDLQGSIAGVKLTPETSAEAQLLADKIKIATEQLEQGREKVNELEQGLGDAKAKASELSGAIDTAGVNKAKILAVAIAGIGKAAQAAARVSVGAFKVIGNAIGGIAKHSVRASRWLFRMARGLFSVDRGSRRASGGLDRLGRRILGIAATAFVFNVIRRAMRGLREEMGALLMANERFAVSWNAIRVNLLIAWAPLWEIIEPAIIRFMDLLARFTSQLSRFMAILFGTTYESARDSAEALHNQSQALKEVAKEAAGASGKLASFDRINQLSKDTAQEAADTGLDFGAVEPPPIVPWIDELAEKLRDLFKAADPAYWFDLGSGIAKWLSDALNNIPWDSLQKSAENLGVNLASFLGGFLSSREMWEAVGRAVAEFFNTILTFMYHFADTFPWGDVGRAFAAGVNEFFDAFNWGLFASTVNKWALGILALIINAIDGISWNNIGKKIAFFLDEIQWERIFNLTGLAIKNAAKGILDTLYEIFTGFDFGRIGTAIALGLNQILADQSLWGKIGKTLAAGINSAIAIFYNFVNTFNWRGFGLSIATAINDFIRDVDWATAGKAFSDGIKGVLELINTVIKETDWQAVGEAIKEFLSNIDWNGIISALFEIVKGAIKAALVVLGEAFSGLPIWMQFAITFGGILGTLATAISTIAPLFAGLAVYAGLVGASMGALVLAALPVIAKCALIGLAIAALVAGIIILIGNWDSVREAAAKAMDGIKNIVSSVTAFVKDNWRGMAEYFLAVFAPAINANINVLKQFVDMAKIALENIKKVWSEAPAFFKGIGDKIKSAFDDDLKATQEFFKNTRESINGVWQTVASWFTSKVTEPVKAAFDAALKAITGFFSSAWEKIQSIWGSAFKWFNTTVIEPIRKAFESVVRAIQSAFQGLYDFITKIFDGISRAIDKVMSAIDKVMRALGGMKGAAGSAGNAVSGISAASSFAAPIDFSPFGNNMNIPHLARGGIVDSATMAMIGEKGREAVVPLDRNKEWIQELAQEIAGQIRMTMPLGGNKNGDVTINAEGDLGQLLRFFRFELKEENDRVGGGFSGVVTT